MMPLQLIIAFALPPITVIGWLALLAKESSKPHGSQTLADYQAKYQKTTLRIRRQRKVYLLGVVLLCPLSSSVLLTRLQTVPFHGDESGWIGSGYYYADLLVEGNLQRAQWKGTHCGFWGDMNMHLGQWLIGLPIKNYIGRQSPIKSRAFVDYYNLLLRENMDTAREPPHDVLIMARGNAALAGCLCCLVVFTLGYLVHSVWVGGLASLLLLTNQLFTACAVRAMADIYYCLFLLLLAVLTILLFMASNSLQVALVSSLCGVMAGLACSTAITGTIVTVSMFALIVAYKSRIFKLWVRQVGRALAFFCVAALTTIYLLNPYCWVARNNETQHTSLAGSTSLAVNKSVPPAVAGLNQGAIIPALDFSPLLEFPRLCIRWKEFFKSLPVKANESWQGNPAQFLSQRSLLPYSSFPGEWIFLLLGIVLCLSKVREAWQRQEVDLMVVALVYFLVNYLCILLLVQVTWDRYYLPAVIGSKFLVGAGIYEALTHTGNYYKQLFHSASTPQDALV